MSKTAFFFATVLFMSLQGCYDIDDNRRVLVTGNLMDDAGSPVKGIAVEARGSGTVLGYNTSDANGDFTFTSLESSAQDFSIYINPEPAQDSVYTSPTYITTDDAPTSEIVEQNRRSQNLYALGDITLRQNAFITIEINRNPATRDTLHYTAETRSALCQNYFSEEKTDAQRSQCFETIVKSGSLLPDNNTLHLDARTLKNTTAIFSYSINSGTVQEIKIPINQYNTRYVFDF